MNSEKSKKIGPSQKQRMQEAAEQEQASAKALAREQAILSSLMGQIIHVALLDPDSSEVTLTTTAGATIRIVASEWLSVERGV
jgi:hypothetical protein